MSKNKAQMRLEIAEWQVKTYAALGEISDHVHTEVGLRSTIELQNQTILQLQSELDAARPYVPFTPPDSSSIT